MNAREDPHSPGLAGSAPDGGGQGEQTVRRPVVPGSGWRIGRLLGEGCHSTVWLAQRLADGACFALKVPHRRQDPAEEFERRREVTILTRLQHENLLGIHGLLNTEEGPGLLLEYAAGGSLAGLLALRGTLSEGEVVTVLTAAARALACLHADGAVHGAVTPGNILFTANGKPLVADFGTGRMFPGQQDVPVGSAGSEPELPIGAGSSAPGPEADVYSLGALGWLMLTGRPLKPGLRPPLSVALGGGNPRLCSLLEAALDEDAGRRPTAEEFSVGVFRAVDAEPLQLPATVPPGIQPDTQTRRAARDAAHPGRRRRRRPRFGLQKARTQETGHPGSVRVRRAAGQRFRKLWLGAATGIVAVTAVCGAVAVLAPELLGPSKELLLPAATDVPAAGAAGEAPSGTNVPEEAAVPEEEADHVPSAGASSDPGQADQDVPSDYELSVLQGQDPLAAVHVLSTLRARSFERGDPALLGWVNLAGSPAEEADSAEVGRLKEKGERLSGLRLDVLRAVSAGEGGSGTDRELVAVSMDSSGFQRVRADGSPAGPPGAASGRDVVLDLVRTDSGWRIAAVLPGGETGGGGAQR
ncbi:serine/threonine-protein kinase [Arthrobacter caoxuetaonis]|uniref:serine/threonine-protein kinase n=1 Tax=Arthrobacter caoxuetaonis TaxID=2886935 RepID=UPI001D1374B5|nr:serine/threonine-protein kinase [Arthrobacter caoxuetaonis]MCC3283732.1 serine/threonine protein kinase [Arthrobacter caoxuetaonis]